MQILPTSISAKAYAYIPQAKGELSAQNTAKSVAQAENPQNTQTSQNPQKTQNSQQESATERVLAQLKAADREVRAHEQAHMAAGAGITGSASYTYKTGPDGKQYAVAGEVPVDTSAGRTPEETLAKAQKIRAAALAPAQPSAQDYKVAQTAASMQQTARIEIAQNEKAEKTEAAEKQQEKTEAAEKQQEKAEESKETKESQDSQNADKNKTALDFYKNIFAWNNEKQNTTPFLALA